MVDKLSDLQLMLAESRFAETQKEVELLLLHDQSSVSVELLKIYFKALKAQAISLPTELVLTFVDRMLPSYPEEADQWMQELENVPLKFQQRKTLIEIQIAELRGKTQILYKLLTHYYLAQYENQIPNIPKIVSNAVNKYFLNDYQIMLQVLALDLLRFDLISAEVQIKKIILSCFEKSSPKGVKDKLNSLYGLLKSSGKIQHLEMYRNLCQIFVSGITEKSDYKRIIELILYLEDFEMQAVLLKLLEKEKLNDLAQDYANAIKMNKNYSYVYFDKYFTELKPFFFTAAEKNIELKTATNDEIDLSLGKIPSYPFYHEILSEISDEEILVSHLIKHQSTTSEELLEIATSFVQSEFYLAALEASEMAFKCSSDRTIKLKASYLKIFCLLKRGDCRAALDSSIEALSLCESQNDILSFLYAQSEALLRLKDYYSAKSVLSKIIGIDSSYRMAKERLDRLNAL